MKNVILFLVFTVLLTGCISQKVFRYEAEPQAISDPLMNANVVVLPFADKRGNDNTDSRGITLIPLMFWGSQNFDVPEKAKWTVSDNQWLFLGGHRVAHHHKKANKKIAKWNPREDIARATADELSAANVFSKTYFGKSMRGSDLILQGIINSSNYYGMFNTYGVSLLSPVFWVLGAPVTINNNTLDITFQLKNRTGTVMWERNYRKKGSTFSSIYYISEDFKFNDLLKDILLEATEDIRAALSHMDAPAPAPVQPRADDDLQGEIPSEEQGEGLGEPDLDELLQGIDATEEEKKALGDILNDLEEE
ncbi:hypothetical protein [Candidatus Uabimicrobium sp. HlEnr_7]|uniref:hypothetical protein n=1 Tax=Candidatus Uabimicrobium helgolandensis TaxID=3095367 RepID=UPI0035584A5B